MKKAVLTLSFFLVAMLGFTAFAQEGQPVPGTEDGPVIKIDKEVHDYGTIDYKADGKCVFTITNTGNQPLIISKCKGSCGCTVPQCTEAPIAPGASSKITVEYDTGRTGPFHKSVTVTSNAVNAPTKVVKIKGTVKPNPEKATTAPAVN
ncbi:DUF1573 domain-containing protein [Crocinitomix algicola]|uniref:DUF1573 domain-containing protein n=1 Tax=Crocinitomix algicola TaxID=1740263 RepID=UPI00083292B6|nr:DUF1573 domain-containing protein [Crocinitomix algicola]